MYGLDWLRSKKSCIPGEENHGRKCLEYSATRTQNATGQIVPCLCRFHSHKIGIIVFEVGNSPADLILHLLLSGKQEQIPYFYRVGPISTNADPTLYLELDFLQITPSETY